LDVTVNGALFHRALAQVARAARVNSPIPILESVLLRCDEKSFSLIATDDEHQITHRITDEWATVAAPGQVALPAKRLLEIAAGLNDQDIHLQVKEFQATLKADRSRYRLSGINPIHFPEFPVVEGEPVLIERDLLRDMMGKCLHAVGKDPNRPGVCGGRLILSDREMVLAATDNRRLILYRAIFDAGASDTETLAVTLPPATMRALLQLPPTDIVAMTCDGQTIRFDWEGGSIASRVIIGSFPDYRKLLALSPDLWLTLERESLTRALKRLQSISREDMNRVRWRVSAGSLRLQAQGMDIGDGDELLTGIEAGEATTVLHNEQILELLGVLEGLEVCVGLSRISPVRAVWCHSVSQPHCLGILMPLSAG
jgi:DNA polymerase III subunit beta